MRRGKPYGPHGQKITPGALRQALDGVIATTAAAARDLNGVARETLADPASFAMGANLWNATQPARSLPAHEYARGFEPVDMPSGLLDILP